MTLLDLTPQVFSLGIIIYLAIMVVMLLIYWALVDGYFAAFFYNMGFVFGAIKDIFCQLWIDAVKIFRKKKKAVKLDEYEQKSFHR